MGSYNGTDFVPSNAHNWALADHKIPQAMSPLTQILRSRIMAQGPINIADYMAECLMHPEHGYYTTQKVFGQNGDFITAPEISQMFGEMIGLSLGSAWQAQGCPPDAIIVELGPG